jgi:hypothetical protein
VVACPVINDTVTTCGAGCDVVFRDPADSVDTATCEARYS